MVRIKRTWSDTDLINAVANSKSLGEVADTLRLVRGGSYKTIKAFIKKLNIDTSHFFSLSELQKRARSTRKLKAKSINEIFIENGEYHDYKRVKFLIIKNALLEYKCSKCSITSWQNEEINLQMDHINGNKCDNRLENLRFLCPNCHSQTDTFCGKNIKREKKTNLCITCGKIIHRQSIWCVACKIIDSQSKTKIVWPSINDLKDMTDKFGFSETGRRLGVSDNAIRKRIKNHGSVT